MFPKYYLHVIALIVWSLNFACWCCYITYIYVINYDYLYPNFNSLVNVFIINITYLNRTIVLKAPTKRLVHVAEPSERVNIISAISIVFYNFPATPILVMIDNGTSSIKFRRVQTILKHEIEPLPCYQPTPDDYQSINLPPVVIIMHFMSLY